MLNNRLFFVGYYGVWRVYLHGTQVYSNLFNDSSLNMYRPHSYGQTKCDCCLFCLFQKMLNLSNACANIFVTMLWATILIE